MENQNLNQESLNQESKTQEPNYPKPKNPKRLAAGKKVLKQVGKKQVDQAPQEVPQVTKSGKRTTRTHIKSECL